MYFMYKAERTLYFLKSAMNNNCTTGLQPAVYAVWRAAKIVYFIATAVK